MAAALRAQPTSDSQESNDPGLEKAPGKTRTRGELGGGAEIGEEDARPFSALPEDLVRAVAQVLERQREPRRCQCFKGDGFELTPISGTGWIWVFRPIDLKKSAI